MNDEKDLSHYLALPYTIELIREDDTTWFGRVAELTGCITEGDSPEEVLTLIQDAMSAWIESALEDGQTIPEPRTLNDFSGKFVVRVSKSLHRDLVEAAAWEDVSLNQFISTELARAVGRQDAQAKPVRAVQVDTVTSDMYWPGLASGLHQFLKSAGYVNDADALDERLCAIWFEERLEEIEAALKVELFQDANTRVDGLASNLHLVRDRSPLIGIMQRMLRLLHNTVEAQSRSQADFTKMARFVLSKHTADQIQANATMAIQDESLSFQGGIWPVAVSQEEESKW